MLILNGNKIEINGGLVNAITILALSNAFAPAAIAILCAENITKRIQQWIFVRLN